MHRRVCYVVLEDGADAQEVEMAIKTMPDYFEPYATEVHFISEESFRAEHSQMPHGGRVLRSGRTGEDLHQKIEFELELESNPERSEERRVGKEGGARCREAQRNRQGARGA